jgi:membrane-associated phospholipid phosphatase
LFRKCIVGLFVLYGLGFIGYTVLPAGGPYRFMTFDQPLQGVWLLDATFKSVNDGSNGVDAFPSIHFAATLYLLMFDWQHARRRFWILLGPSLLLWFATMFLRFHYFVDLVGGAIIAVIGWLTAQWFARNWAENGRNKA